MTLGYCTILARNYLPGALVLAESLAEHGAEHPLSVLLIDATPDTQLPAIDGVRWLTPFSLGLGERTVLELAMSYDLVEFATAIKPPLLKLLLREFDQVVYLDPDTYQVSLMVEIPEQLAAGHGILLTPHFLAPVPADGVFSEGHLLVVGVYNLGFCAVDRRAEPFLDWWWQHLRWECLHDPIGGLFTDQKWCDIGAVLFHATPLAHRGYNVGVANIGERPLVRDADHYAIANGDPLRLFHFHAYDPEHPESLNTRRLGEASVSTGDETLLALSRDYAARVLEKRAWLGPQPGYIYLHDTAGRRIPRRLRHAYRSAAASATEPLPSPFVAADAAAYDRWRRGARTLTARLILSDLAKGIRCALPEEYGRLRKRLPGLTSRLRRRLIEDSGMWG